MDNLSEGTQQYVDSFKRAGKLKASELKLSEDESVGFGDELRDPISLEIMDIPVRLNDNVYDLSELMKLPKDEKTGKRKDPQRADTFFLLIEVQSALGIAEKLQTLLKEIKDKREQAEVRAPGGPAF